MRSHFRFTKARVWIAGILVASLAVLGWMTIPVISQAASPQVKTFEQAWKTVNDNFFDPKFKGVDWRSLREKYAPQAAQAQSADDLAVVVNAMLAELKTSHTRFYTPNETAYYQLLGIFQPRSRELKNLPKEIFPKNKLEYSGIGIFTKAIANKNFVSGVLEGSPAAQAGLQMGDEVLSADGRPFHPV